MRPYIYQSATALAALIRNGEATSTNIVREHLARIKEHNGKLNALISIFEEEALKEASACDQEAAAGRFRGPLHGVPVTIKEQFWIKGKKSNTNASHLKNFVAPEDAVVVSRIRQSGAVILGQTNVPKSLMDYQVNGDIYPEGKNPYHTDYTPGGSTGGGASALAAGFTPLELGGDLGGSVRNPASFCGLYGLKTTEKTVPVHGNIPLPKGAASFIFHMGVSGPLARTPEDLELLWKIMVGPHDSDRNIPDINWKQPVDKSPGEYKIAWTSGWPGYEASSQISEAIQSFSGVLANNGYRVEKRIPDDTLHHDSLMTYVGLLPYFIAQGTPWFVREIIKMQMHGGLLKGLSKTSPEMMREMHKGFKLHANHYGKVLWRRSLITQRWEKFLEEYDFLICPVAFGPAYKRCKIGTKLQYEGKEIIYANYVWPYNACFNVSGNPSITIPLGLGREGLPIGVQVVGKYWSEPELLHFAKKIAGLTPGFIKPVGY